MTGLSSGFWNCNYEKLLCPFILRSAFWMLHRLIRHGTVTSTKYCSWENLYGFCQDCIFVSNIVIPLVLMKSSNISWPHQHKFSGFQHGRLKVYHVGECYLCHGVQTRGSELQAGLTNALSVNLKKHLFKCFGLISVHRLSLNVLTLQIDSSNVYTQLGVPISVTGIAQVRKEAPTFNFIKYRSRSWDVCQGHCQDQGHSAIDNKHGFLYGDLRSHLQRDVETALLLIYLCTEAVYRLHIEHHWVPNYKVV